MSARLWLLIIVALSSGLYLFGLGRASLGSSEAYSAAAAAQPNVGSLIAYIQRFDPGKPGLYQVALHVVRNWFGSSEAVLRMPSAMCGLACVPLVFMIARRLFGEEAAITAAALWAFNPLALTLSRWARPYAMLIALTLAQLLVLLRLRERGRSRGSAAWAVVLALLTASMLYTHLCATLLIAGELAVTARDLYRRKSSRAVWVAFGLAAIAFMPHLPVMMREGVGILYGHWLDYMGNAGGYSPGVKVITVAIASALGLTLLFGPAIESDPAEPIRACASVVIVPAIAIAGCSILIHPAYQVRYVAPCFAVATILAAGLAARLGPRARNLSVAGIVFALLLMAPYCLNRDPEPWREIARTISAAGRSSQPVFFEVNIIGDRDDYPNLEFPDGFLRVPFDHYFEGANPRVALRDFDPGAARAQVERAMLESGGAWLVSAASDAHVRMELPDSGVRAVALLRGPVVTLYHLSPTAGAATRVWASTRG